MKKAEALSIIKNGENSGVEFKSDNIRPEQLAKEIVAFLNFKGGKILLGVEDDGAISGISRKSLEKWVMNVCTNKVHPRIIPYYETLILNNKKIAVVSLDVGTAKPYVIRHKSREDIYIRVGSTSRLATREEQMRLFQDGGILHVESLPVSGTGFSTLDQRRIEDYFSRIRGLDPLPTNEKEWINLLVNTEYMAAGDNGSVCTITGLLLFGRRPKKYLLQAGIQWAVFPGTEKDYDTRDRATLDGPLVALWDKNGEQLEGGLLDLLMSKIRQHASREKLAENNLTRIIQWDFAPESIREAVVNACVHRDWTRPTDIEISLYADHLEIISPGPLPNSVTVERMKQGLRIPRNPILIQTLKDYGYVEHMGMGVKNKIIAGMLKHNGIEPTFHAEDLLLKVCLWRSETE